MRGRGQKHRVSQTRIAGEATDARERLERAWFHRMVREGNLARLVTARDARGAAYHRWLVFKQAFSPKLVDLFVTQERAAARGESFGPMLDPFSGTGTAVTQWAVRGVAAVGVEPIAVNAFVSNVKSLQASGESAVLLDAATAIEATEPADETNANEKRKERAGGAERSGAGWIEWAERLTHPLERAALVCAVASRLTADGSVNKSAPPLRAALARSLRMIAEDVVHPLPRRNPVVVGDARRLGFLADGSMGGVLTSPPYLSRHDYSAITKRYEQVYEYWYGSAAGGGARQVSANAGAARKAADATAQTTSEATGEPGATEAMWLGEGSGLVAAAVGEIVQTLRGIGRRRMGTVVRDYFADLLGVMGQLRRVLQAGAPCWVVIAGARLKDVYVPTDTILAEAAGSLGFEVEAIRVARTVTPAGRRFGTLSNVAPRESLVVMRRR